MGGTSLRVAHSLLDQVLLPQAANLLFVHNLDVAKYLIDLFERFAFCLGVRKKEHEGAEGVSENEQDL